jgi:hypothetical protein
MLGMQVIQRIPATIHVSSDYYICVRMLLYMCPRTTISEAGDLAGGGGGRRQRLWRMLTYADVC